MSPTPLGFVGSTRDFGCFLWFRLLGFGLMSGDVRVGELQPRLAEAGALGVGGGSIIDCSIRSFF